MSSISDMNGGGDFDHKEERECEVEASLEGMARCEVLVGRMVTHPPRSFGATEGGLSEPRARSPGQ